MDQPKLSAPPGPAPEAPAKEPPFLDWADQYLAQIPSGIDPTQIAERLRMTPTERLEAMQQFSAFLDAIRGTARAR